MTKTLNWSVSKTDAKLIGKIMDRALRLLDRNLDASDRLGLYMDITACHANGNPLRLKDLLEADDFEFSHDVFGISRHIDRETGQLTDCFSPRFSQRD